MLSSQDILPDEGLVVARLVHGHIREVQFQRLGQADSQGWDHPDNVDGHSVGPLRVWDRFWLHDGQVVCLAPLLGEQGETGSGIYHHVAGS